MSWRWLALAPLGALGSGCRGKMSMLEPAGPQAERFTGLWWPILIVLGVVYVLVAVALLVAVLRGRREHQSAVPEVSPPRHLELAPPRHAILVPADRIERRAHRVIAVAVGVTVLVLFVFLVASYRTGAALSSLGGDQDLVVEVTGRQWWWEFRYLDPVPSQILLTANELHIPTGRPVQLKLRSSDVIHSFWVPRLGGKRDLIPGQEATLVLQADRPGEYEGTCAEFCGLQHAHMSFLVVAEPEDAFRAWKSAQLLPARPPQTDEEKKGQQVFLQGPCVLCHTISGTPAGGTVGPPLTHLASQRRLGAGLLPNTRGHLAGWISDPQSVKPGVRMPPNVFAPAELAALLTYLESLR